MKGGGAKGIALVGAVQVLVQNNYHFTTYVGTSAGAIVAVLLAAGHSPERLENILERTQLDSFLEGRRFRRIINWVTRGAPHRGSKLTAWIDANLRELALFRDRPSIQMNDLPRRAIVYAAQRRGTFTFQTRGEHGDLDVATAVQSSAAIPFFFERVKIGRLNLFDGGAKHNFPVNKFLQKNPGHPFIGLYLEEEDPQDDEDTLGRFFKDVMIGVLEQDEAGVLAEHERSIIRIPIRHISTTDFTLSPAERAYLLWQGRASAWAFLARRDPASHDMSALVHALEMARKAEVAVIHERRNRTRARWPRLGALTAGLLLGVMAVLGFQRWSTPPDGPAAAAGPKVYAGRDVLFRETNISDDIAAARTSFKIVATSAVTLLEQKRDDFMGAIERGVNVQFLLAGWPHEQTNEAELLYCAWIDNECPELIIQRKRALRILSEMSDAIKLRPESYRGTLEVRLWPGPMYLSLWFMDQGTEAARGQWGVYSFGDGDGTLFTRVSSRDAAIIKIMARQFGTLWNRSAAPDPPKD